MNDLEFAEACIENDQPVPLDVLARLADQGIIIE